MTQTVQPIEIRIDNEKVSFKANSYVEIFGAGEVETKSQQIGGGSVEAVHQEDYETKVGCMKFACYNTEANNALFEKIMLNRFGHKVEAIFNDGSTKVLTNSAQQEDPENAKQKDGGFELNFKGNPLIA